MARRSPSATARWSSTRFDDIVAVTKRRDVHSIDPDMAAIVSMALGAGRPLIPLMLDGEQHTKYRKLLDPLFAPKQVARLEPVIRNLSETLIDAFAADGAVDFFAAFCEPLPSQIFLSQLGLPLDDVPFLLWVKNGIIRPTDEEHQQAAGPKLIEYLYAELDRRAAESEPRDDLIGGFLTAEVDGHRLTREDVIDITFLLVLAGLDTVTSSLSCMVDWLARHPAERDRLVADPALLPQAIEELMRVQTPVVAGSRHATADFELDGVEIKAGDELRVVWAAADMDPDVFPEPTTRRPRAGEQPPHCLRQRLPPVPRLPPGATRAARRARDAPSSDSRLPARPEPSARLPQHRRGPLRRPTAARVHTRVTENSLDDVRARLRRLEDESAIQRLIMSYGPAADAALASLAGRLWLEDGVYDWDANGEPHEGSAAVEEMLRGENHLGLVGQGVAHFGGPLLIDVDGDRATAVNYSLIMRREQDRHYLWRVSAVRWDVERSGSSWRVRRRSNRLLDASGAGSQLFGETLEELFGEEPR